MMGRSLALAVLLGCLLSPAGAPAQSTGRQKPIGKVLFFLSTDCPVALRQSPRMATLISRHRRSGLSFEAVFPNALETRDKAKRFLKDRGLSIPFSLDEGARRAVRNNVEVVPTVILFDQAGKQIYFGAFDDAKASNIVKVSFLEDAIEQFLSGKKVQRPFGKPFGCFLMP